MTPFIETQIDTTWYLQGRIIPPSCSKGDGCVLHLQTRNFSWADGHVHIARLVIGCEAALEVAIATLEPPNDDLLRTSLCSGEDGIDYLAMAKLNKPEHSIAFPTANGLTIVIHNERLSLFFGPSDSCENCQDHQAQGSIMVPVMEATSGFDVLMHMDGKRNH